MITQALKAQRLRFLDRHHRAEDWRARLFSAATYAQWACSRPVMERHCRGLTLDAGSGRGSWRGAIEAFAGAYESVDLARHAGAEPTWIADVTDLSPIPDGRYDTVVCHQVLEHVRRPHRAMSAFFRVLRADGKLIATVPHVSRRHELPNDYFRYTQEGFRALAEDAGFEVLEAGAYGGLLSFLHHQTSFVFPGLVLGIPVVEGVALAANAPLSCALPVLDRLIDRSALIPLGILLVAQKPRR